MTIYKRIGSVIVLILLISFSHYTTNIHHPFLHVIHRELFLVPIILSAYWFGLKGGLIVSIISSLIYIPQTFMGHQMIAASVIGNVFDLLTFNIIAYLVGKMQDIKKNQFVKPLNTSCQNEKKSAYDYDLMICIDNSQNTLKTARYVVNHFARHDDMSIAIIGFIMEPPSTFFPDEETFAQAKKDNTDNVSRLAHQARDIVLAGGFNSEKIIVKTTVLHNITMTNSVVEEQRIFHCKSVIIGGSYMSKPEEFILGNTPVKLIREARFSVITVY